MWKFERHWTESCRNIDKATISLTLSALTMICENLKMHAHDLVTKTVSLSHHHTLLTFTSMFWLNLLNFEEVSWRSFVMTVVRTIYVGIDVF